MQKVTERQLTTRAWAASTTLQGIDLPRTGLVTEVRVRHTATATLTASAVPDATRRALDGLEIRGNNLTFMGLTGNIDLGTLLALLNMADFGVTGMHHPTEVADTVFDHTWVFHPGSNPKDPFDMSVVIPAKKLADLQALINAPAAAVTDTNGNITAGTYRVEVDTVKGVKAHPGLFMPAARVNSYAPSANGDYEIDVPSNGYLRRIVILSLNDVIVTPLRVDDEISVVKLTIPDKSTTVVESNWEDFKFRTARRYGILGDIQDMALGSQYGVATNSRPGFNGSLHLPVGFGIIDLRDYADYTVDPLCRLYGINLLGQKTGYAKLTLTITNQAAGDRQIVLWDIVQPIDPALVE